MNLKGSYKKYIFFFCILVILYFVVLILMERYYYQNKNHFKHNKKEHFDYISKETCGIFKQKIMNNIYLVNNPLNEQFENTKGILIQFDENNAHDSFRSKNIEFLYPYFKKIKKPYATNFVLNALVIPPSKKEEMSIKYHYDTTLDMNEDDDDADDHFFNYDIVPECVSVLYIEQPTHMKGGRLRLYKYANLVNIANVSPSVGKLVEFNGRLFHGVESFHDLNDTNTERISIVLEQYCV